MRKEYEKTSRHLHMSLLYFYLLLELTAGKQYAYAKVDRCKFCKFKRLFAILSYLLFLEGYVYVATIAAAISIFCDTILNRFDTLVIRIV